MRRLLLLAAGVLAGLGIAVVGWVLATTAGDGGASGVFAERARPQESSASVRPAPSAPSAACVEAEALLEDAWGAGHLEADPAVARAREVFARVSAADAASPCAAAGLAAAEALNPARSIGDDVPPTPDRARKLLARARALDGQSVLVARTDALLKSEAGDNAGAAQVMEAAVATDESRPGPWRDLARYHGRQFRVNKARAAFQRARALSSSPVDQARVHLEIGEMDDNLGLADAARDEYEEATRLRPDHVAAWTKLAWLELRTKRCREAEAAAAKVEAINGGPRSASLRRGEQICQGTFTADAPGRVASDFLRIGNAERDRGRYAAAEAAYAKVTCCVPETELALARAELALRRGRAEEALSELVKSFAAHPGDVNVLVAVARVEWAGAHLAEARAVAQRALELELTPGVTSSLDAAMGSDAEYRALRDRTWTRVQALFSYFEGKYDYQHLPRDNATTIWILGQLGMTHKDRGAVRLLEDYLAHSAIEDVRARTADALWLIGDRSSVPALLAALGDPSLKVKGYAASGLGDLGDVSAVDPLLALFATLPDNKEETKARIADALGKLGDRRAAPAIKASLDVIRDPAYVRWARPALDRLTR